MQLDFRRLTIPLGTIHEESGLLLEDRDAPVLIRHDGGTWRLRAFPRWRDFLGKRVHLRGQREAFDALQVLDVVKDGAPLPAYRQPVVASWEFAAGVFTTLAALALITTFLAGHS